MKPYYMSPLRGENGKKGVIPNYVLPDLPAHVSPIYLIRQGEDEGQISQGKNTVSLEQNEQHLSEGDGGTSNATQDNIKLNKPELLRYACRKKADSTIEYILPNQTSILDLDSMKSCGRSLISISTFNSNDSSLDLPIAIRKEIRSCTKHPVSNFVWYNFLSPSYRAFVFSLSSIFVTQNLKGAHIKINQ